MPMASFARLVLALFLGIFLYGWIAKSWFGVDVFKAIPASEQVSTGNCTLPYTKAHTTLFSTKDRGRQCLFRAVEGSFREARSSDQDVCFVTGYNLEGRLDNHGRYGRVCEVFMSEAEWKNHYTHTANKALPHLPTLQNATTVDFSTTYHLRYRILYSGPPGDEFQLNRQLGKALDEAGTNAAFFMGPAAKYQVTVAIYAAGPRLKKDAFFHSHLGSATSLAPNALCVSHARNGTLSRECSSERLAIWRSQLNYFANLEPAKRREIFIKFAWLVSRNADPSSSPYYRKAYNPTTTVSAQTSALEYLGDYPHIHKVTPTEKERFLKEYDLTEVELDHILKEGYVLGWAFPMIGELNARLN